MNKFHIFLWIIISQTISLLGSAITRFALGIWIYQETGQVIHFAIILVASYLPSVFVAPFAGNGIDRFGPKWALLVGGLLGTSILLLASVFIVFSSMTSWIALMLAGILSVVSALETPALQALTPQLVEDKRLSRANGLVATGTSVANIVGPVVAGILYTFGDMVWIVISNGLSYVVALVVVVVLWRRFPKCEYVKNENEGFLKELIRGFVYTWNEKALLALILFHMWANVALGINSVIRQPYLLAFGTEEQFGFVTALFGVGMVLGGFVISTVKIETNKVWWMLLASFGMGVAVLATGITETILLIGGLWLFMGFCLPITNALSVTLIQQHVESTYLGRVFSIARMLSWATLPIAYLVGGLMGDWLMNIGFSSAYRFLLIGSGVLLLLFVCYYGMSNKMKPLEKPDR
ncbi:MFS transporter [Shouchella sp. JSM 1781072]|uniref:MFS transporter n=1 Tax=Shouchella sp. JSM 1781072 TaxID=3344581 RepID=UPI0035C20B07